jgi:Domain of unknown function (DUF3859)
MRQGHTRQPFAQRIAGIVARIASVPVLLMLGCLAASGQEASAPEARMVWYGCYSVGHDRVIADAGALDGHRTVSTGIVPPASNEDRIPAILHTRFGFGFTLASLPIDGIVRYRFVRKYPAPGLRSGTGEQILTDESGVTAWASEKVFLAGYVFDEDREMVPGVWTLQVWQSDHELLEKSFTVYTP